MMYHLQISQFDQFYGSLSSGVNGFSLTGPCQKFTNTVEGPNINVAGRLYPCFKFYFSLFLGTVI